MQDIFFEMLGLDISNSIIDFDLLYPPKKGVTIALDFHKKENKNESYNRQQKSKISSRK